jgi:hypothetical protein
MTTDSNDRTESFFTPLNDENENVERTCATLCIYAGDMHPNAVTDLLCIQPSEIVAVGERGRVNRLGLAPVGKINGWFLSSEDSLKSKDLRSHLDWLVARLQPSREGLGRLQLTEGVRMYVSCPWWSRGGGGGPSLWPKQMRGLAELNLECRITFADYSDQATERVDTRESHAET